MYVLQYLTAVMTIGLAVCQGPKTTPRPSTADRLAHQIELLQPQSIDNVTIYVAAAEAPPIPQLYISDEEAKELCSKYAKGHAKISVTHPKTCSAYVLCTRDKLDYFKMNTVYMITAHIFATSEKTFWDEKQQSQVSWRPLDMCESDPCKTGKSMTEGRNCSSYLTCLTTGETSTYEQHSCDDNQSFDVDSGNCVSDVTCRQPVPNRYTNLYCNATVPKIRIPGLLPGAYYNRTFKDEKDGSLHTVTDYCSASMVFDQSEPKLCKCIPEDKAKCPKTLVLLDSDMPSNNWYNAPRQDGQYQVERRNTQYLNWARFDGTDMSFYSASGLANNELTNDFALEFRFSLDQVLNRGTGPIALMSNSRNSVICPTATFSVYVNRQNNVVADVTSVMGKTATVQSSGVNTRGANTVVLRRNGGQLAMSINGGPQAVSSGQGLGSERLRANFCGLIIGKANGLRNLIGWVDKVKLETLCPPPEK